MDRRPPCPPGSSRRTPPGRCRPRSPTTTLRAAGTLTDHAHAHAVARGTTPRRHLVNVPARIARPQGKRTPHPPVHWPRARHWKTLWDNIFTDHSRQVAARPPTTGPRQGPTRRQQWTSRGDQQLTHAPNQSTDSAPPPTQTMINQPSDPWIQAKGSAVIGTVSAPSVTTALAELILSPGGPGGRASRDHRIGARPAGRCRTGSAPCRGRTSLAGPCTRRGACYVSGLRHVHRALKSP
jgi:hypothetical protein